MTLLAILYDHVKLVFVVLMSVLWQACQVNAIQFSAAVFFQPVARHSLAV